MLPTHKNEKPASHLKIFCFAVESLDPKTEFIVCCGLVYLFFLIYGYLAELIFTLNGVSGWYITLVQFFFYTIFGLIENAGKTRSVPIKIYLLLAFLTLGTMVSLSTVKLLNLETKEETLTHFCFNSTLGIIQLRSRASQLSHPNNFQKLQAHSGPDWIHSHSEEAAQSDGFHSCPCHVGGINLLHSRRLESLAKVQQLWCDDNLKCFSIRCCDWKRSGAGDEEAQSVKQRNCIVLVRNWLRILARFHAGDWRPL